MKTSKFFFSTLIAASAMTATAYADLSTYDSTNNTINWVSGQANAFKYNTDGTWTIGTVSADGSISWSSDTASSVSRVNDTGWIAYFDGTNQTISASTTLDSSDGGGIIVTGTGNTVTASVGRWAGSIQVDAGNTLNTSWSTRLKDGLIIANGTVNITGGNLNFDGPGVRTWYTGANGQINVQGATNVSDSGSISATGSGTVAFSSLTSIASGSYIEAAGSTITFNSKTISGAGFLKLTSGHIEDVKLGSGLGLAVASGNTGTLSGVTFASGSTLDLSGVTLSSETAALTNSGNIKFEEGSKVDLGKIVSGTTYKIFSDSDNVTGWESLDAGSFSFELKEGGVAFRDSGGITLSNGTFTFANGTAGNLVWAGTEGNATWNSSATNWLNNESADKFYTGDNVTFGADAKSKTVSFESGAELAVGTATIESGTSYTFADPVSLSGTSFTVGKNATLVLSSNAGPARYNFDFDNSVTLEEGATVELAGWAGKLGFNKLVMKNNSSLLFKNGNGTGGEIGSASSQIVVDAAQGVVTIAGSTNGNSSNVMGGISGIGTVKFGAHGGTNEYTISATIKDGENAGDKLAVDVALNSGQTVNLTGTNTYSGGTTITSGTLSVSNASALGTGAVKLTNVGADGTTTAGGVLNFSGSNFASDLTIEGEGSKFVQANENGADQLVPYGTEDGSEIQNTITVANGGVLDLGSNRWSIKNGNKLVLDGGIIQGKGQPKPNDGNYYGILDFCGYNGNGDGGVINTVVVKNTYGKESTISGPVRLRSVGANFSVEEGAVLNITGRLANNGAFEKSGLGKLVLSIAEGAVTTSEAFSGKVTISGGQLAVATTGALGSGNVKVSGGQLSIGNGVEVSNAITIVLDSAYTANAAIDGTGTLKSAITISGDLDALVTLQRSVAQQYEYQLLSNSLTTNGVTVTLSLELENAILAKGWTCELAQDGSTLTLTIPEPSAFGLLAGVGALALVASRRRRARR